LQIMIIFFHNYSNGRKGDSKPRAGVNDMNERTILLVEDDRHFKQTTSRMLELKGYEVRTASDVPTARRLLAEFKENASGVVLMDIDLPGGNGIDLCREIRESSELPVIFLSGLEKTDELLERVFSAGGHAYMTKPVNFNDLVLRIEEVLGKQ